MTSIRLVVTQHELCDPTKQMPIGTSVMRWAADQLAGLIRTAARAGAVHRPAGVADATLPKSPARIEQTHRQEARGCKHTPPAASRQAPTDLAGSPAGKDAAPRAVRPTRAFTVATIRRAVTTVPRLGFDAVAISRDEASELLAGTGQGFHDLRGFRFAVGLRRRADGSLASLAVCSRPRDHQVDDGNTVELLRFEATDGTTDAQGPLQAAVDREAACRGYVRLVGRATSHCTEDLLQACGFEPFVCVRAPATAEGPRHLRRACRRGQSLWVKLVRAECRHLRTTGAAGR